MRTESDIINPENLINMLESPAALLQYDCQTRKNQNISIKAIKESKTTFGKYLNLDKHN